MMEITCLYEALAEKKPCGFTGLKNLVSIGDWGRAKLTIWHHVISSIKSSLFRS